MPLPTTDLTLKLLTFQFCLILLVSMANCLRHLSNETDRLSLLEFKAQISNDPYGILSSWNDSTSFCKWEGVTCARKHQRVTSLDLQGLSLTGTLSPCIKNLTFLRFLNLATNRFHGEIPREVGHLFRLRYLNLSANSLGGGITGYISNCSKLKILDLGTNNLTGKIPVELGFLKMLGKIYLGQNKLIGEIPHSFGNLSSLEKLFSPFNHLEGNIPSHLGLLPKLTHFSFGMNNLRGAIPSTLCNLSSLIKFAVPVNQLDGTLPPNTGLTLPNLQIFSVGGNQIHGSIPTSITNASQLQVLDIFNNTISGPVPNNLGYLKSIRMLGLGINFLGNNTIKDLNFMTSLSNCSNLEMLSINGNNFGGLLPSSIANMSSIQRLHMGKNQFYGKIPMGVGDLVNLYLLDISVNLLSGPIPDSLGKLVKLQGLGLSENRLSGKIPHSLCNLTKVAVLDLRENKLEGNLIPCIGNLKSLQHFSVSENNLNGSIPLQILDLFALLLVDLSQNAFTGLIPLGVCSMKGMATLDISGNKLSGKIPETLGDCLSLEFLHLGGNMLQGDIPSSLGSLKGLQELYLSRNNLSGNIPKELEKLMFLQYLDLSFNNLKGEVPKKGVFNNVSAFSVDGNIDLCGGIIELQLPPCLIKIEKQKKDTKAIIVAAIISLVLIFVAITSLYVFYPRNSRTNPATKLFEDNKLPRISYNELLQATNGFSSGNIIGEGSFGFVYRGNLDQQEEKLVAVKVFKLQQHGASKSILAECKALRSIRHKNLVKILTYCSSIDFKGNDFKALVFDFMENGSLEMWLHPERDDNIQSRSLSLLQRLGIAIDVSSALHYLHDHCETPIVHCDLKPSNILFDSNMTAHVGDFGLARLLSHATDNSMQGETSLIGIKGTIGYMAPEYGVGSQATKHGDAFSFGIILLEIFTGKRPTDPIFADGLNLHNFVKANLPTRVMHVLDPVLITTRDVTAIATRSEVMEIQEGDAIFDSLRLDDGDVHNCIVSVLEIGLACSAELSIDRMQMGVVTKKLNDITEAFMRTRTRRGGRVVTR